MLENKEELIEAKNAFLENSKVYTQLAEECNGESCLYFSYKDIANTFAHQARIMEVFTREKRTPSAPPLEEEVFTL